MSLQTPLDIPIHILVPSTTSASSTPFISTERRITPTWTISHLKSRLEPITGIPSSSQSLRLKSPPSQSLSNLISTTDSNWITITDSQSLVSDPRWSLRPHSELYVFDTRPAGSRIDFSDVSKVEKYQMPESQYEQLSDSVLAWKRREKLGRFSEGVKEKGELVRERSERDQREVQRRGIEVGRRARVGEDDGRRGTVRFLGVIGGLGGEREEGCVWVGVELDEPVGRNDGSVDVEVEVEGEDEDGIEEGENKAKREKKRVRVFECRDKFGVFARPEKVEVGDQWKVLDDLEDEDMEEI